MHGRLIFAAGTSNRTKKRKTPRTTLDVPGVFRRLSGVTKAASSVNDWLAAFLRRSASPCGPIYTPWSARPILHPDQDCIGDLPPRRTTIHDLSVELHARPANILRPAADRWRRGYANIVEVTK